MSNKILLVLGRDTYAGEWIALAKRLLTEGGEIYIRGLITVEESTSLSEGALAARMLRESLNPLAANDPLIHDDLRIHVDYKPLARVIDEIPVLNVDLLLLGWHTPKETIGGLNIDTILQTAPCDVIALFRDNWLDTNGEAPVLLSLRGGTNLNLGIRAAAGLSKIGEITLFHSTDQNRASTPDLERILRMDSRITRTVTVTENIMDAIQRESRYHGTIVIGATLPSAETDTSPPSRVIERLYDLIPLPLAIVRTYRAEATEFHIPHVITTNNDDVSTRVDRWFAENTFDSSEFANLQNLMVLKEKQGTTISLILPALNEEETVGNVITTLKTSLMDEVPLIDEIVLIDSMSTDQTVPIAESLGIPVYKHPEILPEVGTLRGKGEALWKSLHVTKGDIVAWADTDITNIHPRFVYGLIGPLLKHPNIQYVKGFYQRPIQVEGRMQPYGGGRVTELVARPLFNLFYPELSGIIQPLSGEYAGRRNALEQIPFFSGYGVETALLIDILERFGLDAIAQTDLEVRVHHNQPLVGLSKMSFAILQVFIARLEDRFGVQLLEKGVHEMKLILQQPEVFALQVESIGDTERPPMISLPAYQKKRIPTP